MNLKLNWIGIHVSDFKTSLQFYTETLGMNASEVKPDWAYIESTGLTFELFGGGTLHTSQESSWGHGQPIRPSIQVADLHKAVAELGQHGVQFTGNIKETLFGEMIEFAAPENLRWTLVRAPEYPGSANLKKPRIGWLELKANRLAEQQVFYTEILGMRSENRQDGQVILRQGPDQPFLLLESGGQRATPFQVEKNTLEPMPSHLMSVETDNIEDADAWFKSHNIELLTQVTHKAWGGIDFYIVDADGNPIQIVQYVQPIIDSR